MNQKYEQFLAYLNRETSVRNIVFATSSNLVGDFVGVIAFNGDVEIYSQNAEINNHGVAIIDVPEETTHILVYNRPLAELDGAKSHHLNLSPKKKVDWFTVEKLFILIGFGLCFLAAIFNEEKLGLFLLTAMTAAGWLIEIFRKK